MTTAQLVFSGANPATGKFETGFDINDYYQITGSGFGSKISEFGFYQNFETVALNADVSPGSNAGGTGLVLREGGGHQISTELPHSGSRGWKKTYTGSQFPKLGIDFPSAHKRCVFSCWWRYKSNSMTGAADWKLSRAGNRQSDPYSQSRFDHEYTGNLIPNAYTVNTGVTIGGDPPTGTSYNPAFAGILKGGASKFFPQPNTWYFYQMICDAGDYLTNNNYFEIKLNGISQGYFDGTETSDTAKAFRNVDHPDGLWGILTPITGLTNATSVDVEMWMDEVFLTTGWNYCIMTDTPIWTNYTKLAQLKDGGWGDNSILIDKSSKGVFTTGESAYIHIFKDNAVYQSIPVTVW